MLLVASYKVLIVKQQGGNTHMTKSLNYSFEYKPFSAIISGLRPLQLRILLFVYSKIYGCHLEKGK